MVSFPNSEEKVEYFLDTPIVSNQSSNEFFIKPLVFCEDDEVKKFFDNLFDPCQPPIPNKIIRSGDATVVYWKDGSKTLVKKEEGKEDNEYVAFCAALAKKLYGSTDKVVKYMDEADVEKITAKKKAESAKIKKKEMEEKKRIEAQNAKRRLDAAVKKKRFEQKVEEEYNKKYNKEK